MNGADETIACALSGAEADQQTRTWMDLRARALSTEKLSDLARRQKIRRRDLPGRPCIFSPGTILAVYPRVSLLTQQRPFEFHHCKERVMSDHPHLLIVEDSEATIIFLSRLLEEHGYQYQVARNGAEAISALRESRPELVLLDVMMPQKSGIHVLREMKGDPELESIPVIIVTGLSEVTGVDVYTGNEEPTQDEGDVVAHQFGSVLADKLRGLAPDGIIEKPISPPELIHQIQNLLSWRATKA
jgi:CheY-like chemotaxis protein